MPNKTKNCALCKQEKLTSAFSILKGRLRPWCKECMSKYSQQWRTENREKYLKYLRRYYLKNQEQIRVRTKQWRQNNPATYRTLKKRQYARNKSAVGTCSKQAYQWRWEYYGGLCWICQKPATEMDHIIPLCIRPISWPANLRPICSICNNHKSGKHPLKEDLSWLRYLT